MAARRKNTRPTEEDDLWQWASRRTDPSLTATRHQETLESPPASDVSADRPGGIRKALSWCKDLISK